MIGFRHKPQIEKVGSARATEDDKIEQLVFALKNRLEGKHVYFFQHKSEGTYSDYYYKAIIVENNALVDISPLFVGISSMLQFNSRNSIYFRRNGGLEEAMTNLSLIVYGKTNGFSYSVFRFD